MRDDDWLRRQGGCDDGRRTDSSLTTHFLITGMSSRHVSRVPQRSLHEGLYEVRAHSALKFLGEVFGRQVPDSHIIATTSRLLRHARRLRQSSCHHCQRVASCHWGEDENVITKQSLLHLHLQQSPHHRYQHSLCCSTTSRWTSKYVASRLHRFYPTRAPTEGTRTEPVDIWQTSWHFPDNR